MMKIKIGNRLVGDDEPCFIIAEAGVNHNGEIDIAKKLVDAAKSSGSDAVKFQTFKSEKIVTPYVKQAKYQVENIGKKESQYEMLRRLELNYDDFRELKDYCVKKGITFLSAPHSCKEDVDLVAELCPAIKVPSGDLTNLPILKYMAGKQMPIILSTGMSTMEEVKDAVNLILSTNKQLILLHCTTNYPTTLNEVNLKAMNSMKKFGLPVGYSDHTIGINISAAAVALGACVIEKHFTLDKNMEGPDHKASLEPHELKQMISDIRDVEQKLKKGIIEEDIVKELGVYDALGDGIKKPTKSELETMKVARKSIVAACDIESGTVITEDMLAIKRPGTGLSPKYYWDLIGKRVKTDIKQDELIIWNKIE
ncbi:MAG: N-acetylneuraminate synthase family protein [Candidatus Aenigmatarchaeota archaeon]